MGSGDPTAQHRDRGEITAETPWIMLVRRGCCTTALKVRHCGGHCAACRQMRFEERCFALFSHKCAVLVSTLSNFADDRDERRNPLTAGVDTFYTEMSVLLKSCVAILWPGFSRIIAIMFFHARVYILAEKRIWHSESSMSIPCAVSFPS